MSKTHASLQRSRGRQKRRRSRKGPLIGLGIVALVALLVLRARCSRAGDRAVEIDASLPPVVAAAQPLPPGAEPNGRAWGPAGRADQNRGICRLSVPGLSRVCAGGRASGDRGVRGHRQGALRDSQLPVQGAESQRAAEASYCAAEQDGFWPTLRSTGNQPAAHGADNRGYFSDRRLETMASQLGLDTAFSQCLASNTYAQQVQADYNRAVSLNIQSTPTFVINGQLYPGIQQVE